MAASIEQLKDHSSRLAVVIMNVASYRSLQDIPREFSQNYWILIYNNFFDLAVLGWCKIFGTHSEPTHWKNIVDDHETFRKGLLAHLGISEGAWEDYWQEVKNYRDSEVSHALRNPAVTRYPNLDNALEACYYYYNWLINKLRGLGNRQYPDDLKDYYNRYLAQAKKFSLEALTATEDITEQVPFI